MNTPDVNAKDPDMSTKAYRARRLDNGEWVFGFYVCLNKTVHRIYNGHGKNLNDKTEYLEYVDVDPKTVTRFTGKRDKGKNPIFQDDILEEPSPIITKAYGYKPTTRQPKRNLVTVVWNAPEFKKDKSGELFDLRDTQSSVIVGNVHNNPHMIYENDFPS